MKFCILQKLKTIGLFKLLLYENIKIPINEIVQILIQTELQMCIISPPILKQNNSDTTFYKNIKTDTLRHFRFFLSAYKQDSVRNTSVT